jgi:DNA polymerase-1
VSKKKLFLIDAHALCYSSFYGIRELINSKGQPTNAVYGFLLTLRKILREYEPQYVGVCFDSKQKTLRQEKFASYKIQRQPMPDGLVSQISLIKSVIEAHGLKIFEVGGYEADDLIATIALEVAKDKDIEVIVATEDKDMYQLAEEGIKFYSTRKDLVFGKEEIQTKFGFEPRFIVDFLSLAGDSSDNIPGVKGIGEVTARQLIQEYGNLNTILKKAETIKSEKLREKLMSQKEQAQMSYDLALLEKHVPFEFSLEDLKIANANQPKLIEIYRELEFKKFLQELVVEEPAVATQKIKRLDNKEDFGQFLKWVGDEKEVGFLIPEQGENLELDDHVYLIVKENLCALSRQNLNQLDKIFSDKNILKVTHDLKSVLKVLGGKEIIMPNSFDVMLASYLLGGQQNAVILKDLIWSQFKDANGRNFTIGDQAAYLLKLHKILTKDLKEKCLDELMEKIELPLSFVLHEMEYCGVTIDRTHFQNLSDECEKKISILTKELYKIAGEEFNLNSPKQLSHILFDVLKLPIIKRTKTGLSTDEGVLVTLAANHKFPQLLLEYRQLAKLKSTYIDALPKMIDPKTGRIHTDFDQIGAETGRLSSRNPNLQNIPIRAELGREIRRGFIPSEKEFTLIAADYSQIELRILAHLSGDKTLTKAFKEDQDIHNYTASLIFDVKDDKIDYHMRDTAKRINFGIVYGMSSYGLSKDLKISVTEAQDFIDRYFLRYPDVKKFMDNTIKLCEKQGFVTTLFNRRRYIPSINDRNMTIRQFAQRQAINTPVQGSAADLMKLAMINVSEELKKQKSQARMLITVHDELVFEAPTDHIKDISQRVKKVMEHSLKIDVPIKVTVKSGPNWLTMKELSIS